VSHVSDYQSAVLAVHLCARMIGQHDLPKLLKAIEDAHSTGPILDPTLYREAAEALRKMREMREDSERLDWLERAESVVLTGANRWTFYAGLSDEFDVVGTLREAIDAARERP